MIETGHDLANRGNTNYCIYRELNQRHVPKPSAVWTAAWSINGEPAERVAIAMGILSKLLSRWIAPSKNVDLALALIEFVQALKMNAMVEKGLGVELLDAWNKDRSFENFNPNDLGLSRYAIFYICNMIFEACLANGIDDNRDALSIVIYVLEQALNIENKDAQAVAMAGLYWRIAMTTGEKLPVDDEKYEPEAADHAIFEASNQTGHRFAGMPGKVEPTDAESKFYAAYCVSLAPEQ